MKSLFVFVATIIVSCQCLSQTPAKTQKEVLGTFEIACKVFNYSFVKSSSGLYSFRLEDPEKEDKITFTNADSLGKFRDLLAHIIANLPASLTRQQTTGNIAQQKTDSINQIVSLLKKWVDDIDNDSVNIGYLNARKDSAAYAFTFASQIHLNSFYTDSSGSYGPFAFIKLLEAINKEIKVATENRTFILNEFEQNSFETIARTLLTRKKPLFWEECKDPDLTGLINRKATSLFFEIKSRLEFKDDEPATGILKLKNLKLNCFYGTDVKLKSSTKEKLIKTQFVVDEITVEFEDGTIKNIFADLKIDQNSNNGEATLPVRFKNVYPISISSRTDPDLFDGIRIFASNTNNLLSDFEMTEEENYYDLKFNAQKTKRETKGQIFFYLSDLLEYYIIAENDREDYSPANVVVNLNKKNSVAELKKEKRSKIITARAFTDFMGLQENEPNGLLQFEVSKRINFNSTKYGGRIMYYNWFSYAMPVLAFTKIEKDRKDFILTIDNIDSSALRIGNKNFRIRAIDLLKFQRSSFDVNLNIIKFNFPEIKSNLQFTGGVGIMRNSIYDTILVTGINAAIKAPDPVNINTNTLKFGFTATWEIKPENRYSAAVGWDYRRLNMLTKGYDFEPRGQSVISTFWFDGFLKTSDDNKLFFRVRMSYDNAKFTDNFYQMQLGYLVNLFSSSNK